MQQTLDSNFADREPSKLADGITNTPCMTLYGAILVQTITNSSQKIIINRISLSVRSIRSGDTFNAHILLPAGVHEAWKKCKKSLQDVVDLNFLSSAKKTEIVEKSKANAISNRATTIKIQFLIKFFTRKRMQRHRQYR